MADDSFHLTPLDIRRYDFGNALRGYDRARVDQFREQVANEVERLVKQAQALEGKAQAFHEQLRAFRERDKAINEALISAQQLRAEVREQAEREAQLILREAKAEGERMIAAAQGEVKKVEGELESLVKQRRAYLLQFRSMVERLMAEIDAAQTAPVTTPVAPPPPEPTGLQPSTPLWLDSVVKE
jgi:DivIVA domain-containing protein